MRECKVQAELPHADCNQRGNISATRHAKLAAQRKNDGSGRAR